VCLTLGRSGCRSRSLPDHGAPWWRLRRVGCCGCGRKARNRPATGQYERESSHYILLFRRGGARSTRPYPDSRTVSAEAISRRCSPASARAGQWHSDPGAPSSKNSQPGCPTPTARRLRGGITRPSRSASGRRYTRTHRPPWATPWHTRATPSLGGALCPTRDRVGRVARPRRACDPPRASA
jgi:hypothetical protein